MHAVASSIIRRLAGWFFPGNGVGRSLRLMCWLASLLVAPLTEAAGPRVWPGYTLSTHAMTSPDGQRDYQIHVLHPLAAPPAAGYPVLYMLDGNALLEALHDTWLSMPDAGNPPLIVAISHLGTQRFDVVARAFDYTPATNDGVAYDPQTPARRAGGARQFADFIEQRVKPAVAAISPVNPRQQGIWGHSYGGLFVLNMLLTRPASFQCYAAASPSLWWREGYLLRVEAQRAALPVPAPSLFVTKGSAEVSDVAPVGDSRALAAWQLRNSVPSDAARAFAARHPGPASYRELPGLSHGEAFAASIEPTLNWFRNCTKE